MNPIPLTKVEALHLDGLRVVLIDKAGKVVFKIPHSGAERAMDLAQSNSYEFTALVARDGRQLAHFKNGHRVDANHKGFQKLVGGK